MAVLRDGARAALPELDEARLGAVVGDLARLDGLARAIRRDMLDMGRALARLAATAGEGGYRSLFRAGLVPVPENRASQLRAVAAAVDAGMIPAESMPRALEPAYRAARLAPEIVGKLLAAGVVRPEATARDIREAVDSPQVLVDAERPLTGHERRRLERRLSRLREETTRIKARLARG